MKKLIISTVFLVAQLAFSQMILKYGSVGAEYGKAITVDIDTNCIVGSLFTNTITVDQNNTVNLTSRGMVDVALTKYDKHGTLLWAKRFGGIQTTDGPHGVETDALGNIYVTGYFGNPADANPRTADFNPNGGGTLTTKSNYDAFLAKYNKDGNYQWALSLGNTAGNTEERGWDIAVDAAGNSYITGAMTGSMDFNPLGTPNIKSVSTDKSGVFLAKYDTNGQNLWAIALDVKCTDVFSETYGTLDIDGNNVYLAGNFRESNINFNPNGSSTLSSKGQTDMFLSSYTQNGSFNWVKGIGGTLADIVSPGALRIDKTGDIYFTGRISGTVNFNTTGGTNNVTGSALFLAKYNSNGTLLNAFGMPSTNGGDGGHRVGFDSENNVYIAGWVSGSTDFDPNGTYNIDAISPTADVFLAKYTANGGFIWAKNFGTTDASANNICAGLIVDQENNPIITGQLFGTNCDVDPSANPYILSSVGQNDCFVIKYNSNGELWHDNPNAISDSQNKIANHDLLSCYPNPFNPATLISYQLSAASDVKLSVYNAKGDLIKTLVIGYRNAGLHQINFDAKDLTTGIYYCRLMAGSSVSTTKISLIK